EGRTPMIYRQSLSGRGILASVAMLSLSASMAFAQGTLAGRVTAQAIDGLPEARVLVVGTSLFGTTGADGRYTIRNVPAGPWVVRVLRVGYQEQKNPGTMTPGETVTVDFTLEQAVVQLNALVATATGEQRRVELGNSVSSIDAASRAQAAPMTSMATL